MYYYQLTKRTISSARLTGAKPHLKLCIGMHDKTIYHGVAKHLPVLLHLNRFLLYAVAWLFLLLIICLLSNAPSSEWNGARLLPAAAWLRGYPLYTSETTGVINGNIYPPLGTLAFLPAALISHPLPAIIAGSMLALLMYLSPGIVALALFSREAGDGLKGILLGCVLYFGVLLITLGPDHSLFLIHADAPAMALSLGGIIVYAKWWASGNRTALAASGVFFISAIWAKQLAIPLVFVFLCLTFFLGNVRSTVIFVTWSVATIIFWLLILTPVVGDWSTVVFNCWTIPGSHPFYDEVTGGIMERLTRVVSQSQSYFKSYWLYYLLTFAIVLALNIRAKQTAPLYFSFTLAASCLIASLVQVPFTLLALLKVGGYLNNLVFSVQPLLLGLVVGSLGLREISKKAGAQWNFVAQSVVFNLPTSSYRYDAARLENIAISA
jgi:hypothetical protein